MITVRMKGGIGNQLFQYAAAYALAKRSGTELNLDIRFFGDKSDRAYRLGLLQTEFQEIRTSYPPWINTLNNRYLNKILRKTHLRSLTLGGTRYLLDCSWYGLNPGILNPANRDTYVEGYYQSEQYFSEYRESLLRQFVPAYAPEPAWQEALAEIQSTNSCAVHVRRGDFVTLQNNNMGSRTFVMDFSYYKRAMAFMAERLDHPVFFWFSDDNDWVRQQVDESPDTRFVSMHTQHPDLDELMLMRSCRSIITANSTFSWWAAWLNEKPDALVVVPRQTYGNPYMIPERWVRM